MLFVSQRKVTPVQGLGTFQFHCIPNYGIIAEADEREASPLISIPTVNSAQAHWPLTAAAGTCEAKGQRACGAWKHAHQAHSYPTQRAGPGPVLQRPAKTTNCNYLRKSFSFEDPFLFLSREGKTKTEGLRLHRASLMLI